MEIVDNYEHIDNKITYILENMKTQEIENLVQDELTGCHCGNICVPKTCICMQRSGALYQFLDKFELGNYTLHVSLPDKPIYECNRNCTCGTLCGNKLTQFGPRTNLKIIKTEDRGLGLMTIDAIGRGKFICEYAGEVISEAEAKNRFKLYQNLGFSDNYIFCINENFGQTKVKTFIDPTSFGNIGRYVNHSCDPNCTLLPVRIHDVIPKLCIFSNCDISANSEITFDYGTSSSIGDDMNRKKCLCMSDKCKKYLPFDESLK